MAGTSATASVTQPPRVGERAPDFTLNRADGTPWTLSRAFGNGPVILCFMPGAFTGTCTREMCRFTDDWAQYEKLGAQVVGVTVDSKHAQAAWTAKEHIQIPLLSDFEKRVSKEWGVAWQSPWGWTNKRSTFLVDRTGTVRYANVQANASEEPPYDDIQKAVQALK